MVKLYLSMDVDGDFVASCLKEAWLTDEEDEEPKIDDADITDFSKRFFKKQSTLQQLPPLSPISNLFKNRQFRFSVWLKAIAAAVILIGTATLVIYNTSNTPLGNHFAKENEDILPGSDKALLTLADGSTISLSEVAEGKIVAREGFQVEKTAEGEIVYRAAGEKVTAVTDKYNSVVTPNGGQYRVILPDGSKVWLNAASSLTYPENFSDAERRVKMTGEVYFEIAKVTNRSDKRVPFFVETDKQEIQVLGTQFNVNAYKDEPYSYTTLVEGSVKVTSAITGKSVQLKPGQQANLSDDLQVIVADMDQQLAWKNGDFVFNQEQLSSLLRKVARWYDVDVVCPADLGKMQLTGMISRNQPLSDVVKSISSIGNAKVTLKGRRIVVEQ